MMREQARILGGLIWHECRTLKRFPVWVIGLLSAGLLAWSEGSSPAIGAWPPAGLALHGFQLGASMLTGIMAFLMTANSIARDLGRRGELILCRPVPMGVYLAGKFLGPLIVSIAVAAMLMIVSWMRPVFSGGGVYDVRPFLIVMGICVAPMLAYTCALAVFLTVLTQRVIIGLPVYLLYLFSVALVRPHGADEVDWLDFTMRLYGRDLVVQTPVRLVDCTFAHLLNPVSMDLVVRSGVYVAVALGLLGMAGWMLHRQRDSRGILPVAIFRKARPT